MGDCYLSNALFLVSGIMGGINLSILVIALLVWWSNRVSNN